MSTLTNISFLGIALFLVVACSPRGELEFVHPSQAAGLNTQRIWVAKFRNEANGSAAFGLKRPTSVKLEEHIISIPTDHQPGQLRLPSKRANPNRHFMTFRVNSYDSPRKFAADVRLSDKSGARETLLFVHGYNTTHAEAVYRFVQTVHDYGVPVPAVLFSWPSAAQARGYIYDRDSVALSRDHLEELIYLLTENGDDVLLAGHSMGTLLIMETLRQMENKAPGSVARHIDGIVLISPDIDPEVFREQVDELDKVPSPFIVMTSRKDGALKLSGLLTGRDVRLGNLADPSETDGLPITQIDLTNVADGSKFDHSTFATSPAAIALLRGLVGNRPLGDQEVADTVLTAG